MSIIRIKKRENPVDVGGVAIEDGRLSLKATGIYAYMCSTPSRWFRLSDLAKAGPDGRDATASGIEELVRYGYAESGDGFFYCRRPIPQELRRRILDENRSCGHCGGTNNLALDHIVPVRVGGQNTEENLRVLCRSCNSRKGYKHVQAP